MALCSLSTGRICAPSRGLDIISCPATTVFPVGQCNVLAAFERPVGRQEAGRSVMAESTMAASGWHETST